MPTKKQIDELSKKLREERKLVDNFDEVSDKLYDGKVNQTHLSRIANPADDHWPKEKAIRDLLIPPPSDDQDAKHTIVVWGPKTKVDEYRSAVPVKDRLEQMMKEKGDE